MEQGTILFYTILQIQILKIKKSTSNSHRFTTFLIATIRATSITSLRRTSIFFHVTIGNLVLIMQYIVTKYHPP